MHHDLVNKDFFSRENEDEELIKDLKSEAYQNINKIIMAFFLLAILITVLVVGIRA